MDSDTDNSGYQRKKGWEKKGEVEEGKGGQIYTFGGEHTMQYTGDVL